MVWNDCLFPGSFVQYRMVESLFPNARKFMFWLFKNVEAQVEVALRFGEIPFLSDDEMLSVVYRLCRSDYIVDRPRDLTPEQRIKLAIQLKSKYRVSNAQLTRILQIPEEEDIVSVIAIGYRNQEPGLRPRKTLEETAKFF